MTDPDVMAQLAQPVSEEEIMALLSEKAREAYEAGWRDGGNPNPVTDDQWGDWNERRNQEGQALLIEFMSGSVFGSMYKLGAVLRRKAKGKK